MNADKVRTLLDKVSEDTINNPRHYTHMEPEYEPINVIEAWGLNYHLGNVLKYISRAGIKDPSTEVEELKKAEWYLTRHINNLE